MGDQVGDSRRVKLTLKFVKNPAFSGLQISERELNEEQALTKSTGSDNTVETIKRWLDTCSKHHKACQLPRSSTQFLSTRVTAVGTVSKPGLRLVNTRKDL
ncbi:hypothetical protein QBC44DRAFT_367677 [Cladorrhinum sp. PSN332]|nr:hypothetical protein QBC44DRAFT_367677 [Cladorrhinum sp. PSN332]